MTARSSARPGSLAARSATGDTRAPASASRDVDVRRLRRTRRNVFPQPSYAYLLGAYLGDGYIVLTRRGVYRLRVACDLAASQHRVVDRARDRGRARAPSRSSAAPALPARAGCLVVLEALAVPVPAARPRPQARAAHRARALAAADRRRPPRAARARAHPLRWLAAHQSHQAPEADRTSTSATSSANRSDDIKRIFCDACDALGVQWRVMNRDSISVARRASVARLDEFIGPKR